MTTTALPQTAIGETGPCPCGCGEIAPAGQKYRNGETCRRRAYRQRVAAEMAAANLPSRPSLKLARSARTPQLRLGDSEKAARTRERAACRDGVQVYFRDVKLADAVRQILADAAEQRDDEKLHQAAQVVQHGLDLRARRIKRRAERPVEPPAKAVELPRAAVAAGQPRPCPGCNGSGVCPTCHGDGRVYDDEHKEPAA